MLKRTESIANTESARPTAKRVKIGESTPEDKPDSPTSLDSLFSSAVVSLCTGKKNVVFYVHQGLIVQKSGFFRDYYTAEEHPKLIWNFPEIDPELMETIVKFMYQPNTVLVKPAHPTFLESNIFLLAQHYMFGAKFRIPTLQNKAIQEISAFLRAEKKEANDLRVLEDKISKNFLLRLVTIGDVYTATTSRNDPLRKILVMNMAQHWGYYRARGMLDAKDDGTESDMNVFVETFPAFTKDLLIYLQSSEGERKKNVSSAKAESGYN